jgi:hypothetical protein
MKACLPFPSIVIRPAFHDQTSEAVAIALELIRERSPNDYFAAVFAFVDTISREPRLWREIVESYIGPVDMNGADAERIRKHLMEERKLLENAHMYAPAALYRGRLLLRLAPTPGEAFDPLRDETNLLTAIALVDATDQPEQR